MDFVKNLSLETKTKEIDDKIGQIYRNTAYNKKVIQALKLNIQLASDLNPALAPTTASALKAVSDFEKQMVVQKPFLLDLQRI